MRSRGRGLMAGKDIASPHEPQRQDGTLLRRPPVRGPRAVVSEDPAGGRGRRDDRGRLGREDLRGAARRCARGRRARPAGTFGAKSVDLGGMTSPPSATANTCSTFGGSGSTAAAARPLRTAPDAARESGVYASEGVAGPAPRMYCTP